MSAINQRIKAQVLSFEAKAREERLREGRCVIGKEALKRQAILKPHTPKKRERRVFVISSIKELRIAFIEMHNAICDKCAECYTKWRRGDTSTSWPPGTFRPPLGVMASALVF